jgi:hypothetical protein
MNGRRGRWNGIDRPQGPASSGPAEQGGTLVAPAPVGATDSTGKPIGWDDPFYTGVNDELADKGFHRHLDGQAHSVGASGFADVDDFRAGLLRGGNDADVDAAL